MLKEMLSQELAELDFDYVEDNGLAEVLAGGCGAGIWCKGCSGET